MLTDTSYSPAPLGYCVYRMINHVPFYWHPSEPKVIQETAAKFRQCGFWARVIPDRQGESHLYVAHKTTANRSGYDHAAIVAAGERAVQTNRLTPINVDCYKIH